MLLGRYTAVLDACVLHPAFLRGSLLWFAAERLYRPVWTEKIFAEWARSLERRFVDPAEKLRAQQDVMQRAFPQAMVTYPPELEHGLTLPDPDDKHVLAAAIVSRADSIITTNLKDFPKDYCDSLNIEIIHPDDFLVNIIDLHPERALSACKRHRGVLKNPAYSAEEFLEKFERAELIQTHQRLAGTVGLL